MAPAKRRSNRNTLKTGALETAATLLSASIKGEGEGESPLSTPSLTPEPGSGVVTAPAIPQTQTNGNGLVKNGNSASASAHEGDADIKPNGQNGVNGGGGSGVGIEVEGTKPSAAAQDWDEQKCPACTEATGERMHSSRKENWIECDNCNTWYHWRCAGNGEDVNAIAKWYCLACNKADPTRIMTLKPPARKSSRKRTQRDYANLDSGVASDPNRFMRMLETKEILPDPFRRMTGGELDAAWLDDDESAMREPVVILHPDGLGMKMPPRDLTVEHVAEYIGEDVPLEVMDVASQSNSPGWDLGKWADYVELEPSKREKVMNVISLEISGTELADMVLPPKIVRDLDWVENFWPSTRKGKSNAYPKVQLYCLMGVAGAWTDWHIDFAGSSVYYHILKGSKVFYFIRPTPANLAAYEKWSGSELQTQTWLGDMVDAVYKVELVEGNTMIIPSGWIHAVHTPMDTVVFGGNFLHSYDVSTRREQFNIEVREKTNDAGTELRVREIEIATQVPKKFTFPMFTKLCWYVGDKYLRDLKSASGASYSGRELKGILTLAEFLVTEARVLEKGSEQAKKEARESIPADRVKDGPAVARELRWRVKQAMGCGSDDEEDGGGRVTAGNKRRRTEETMEVGHFRNFKPKIWDVVVRERESETSRTVEAARPGDGEEMRDKWTAEGSEGGDEKEKETARVVVREERETKIRRTVDGLERHRILRRVEEWSW